jgi:hypothetical protein
MANIVRSIIHRSAVLKKRLDSKIRLASWKSRAMPKFIVIGAMKSGTTSLFYYLSQHPALVPSVPKETHFFDGGLVDGVDEYKYGLPWYLRHFPLNSQLRGNKQTFEASPSYIYHPLVAARLHETLPDVKMILLLRNPTQRAISHYQHKKRSGVEKLPLMEALQVEESRLEPIIASGDYFNLNLRHFAYKARGRYAEQLERYFKLFPREQILVLPSDVFFKNTADSLSKIFSFIGVDPIFEVKDLSPKFVAKNREVVDQEVIDYLNRYFEPYNQTLYKLLGVNYGW